MSALHSPLVLFVIQAGIIIAVSRVVGFLCRFLGQPMVVAEMVAGIVLGPSLFGWLWPAGFHTVFPATSLGILGIMSQIGLILFMFLVGLEFDWSLMRGRGRASVAISHSSILVPFVLGTLLGIWIYRQRVAGDIPETSFLLFMGIAMSITAFPVLARILVERRLMRTKVGAVTIACAAVDDVTAWCLLAFVVSLVRASSPLNAVRTTALALSYVALMVVVARPFLKRLGEQREPTAISQNLVALTLLLLFLSSITTELIGIHALFGAFMFGAIVPKEHGLAQTLAEKLEDLVVVLFLPLFFAYSGIRTQIGLLSSPGDWVTCALVVMVACVGKFGGSAVAARITGLPWRESAAVGILMNTRGLMELVVLNIGLDLGVIPPSLFAMMVIMALVTTFATSPLIERIYPLDELARDLIASEAPTPLAPAAHAYTVLACLSYSHAGPGLAAVGAGLVGRDPEIGKMYALHLAKPTDRAPFIRDSADASEHTAFVPFVERSQSLEVPANPLSFISSHPAREICEVAAVKAADLVLLGWHKPLLGQAMLGGTVHDVMKRAHADVAVLVDRGVSQLKRILVPYLGSSHDVAALRITQRLADHTGAEVTLLHITDPRHKDAKPGVETWLRDVFHREPGTQPGSDGFPLTVKVVEGAPVDAVLTEAMSGYDLLVIGVGREWGLGYRLFGLLPEAILKRSTISVLAVRGGERKDQREAAGASVSPAHAISATPQLGIRS